jgi:outer membrane lipoprotein LolB
MWRARLRATAMVALVVVLVAGCAGLGILEREKLPVGSAESFELQGRVYVRFGTRAFSGSMRWRYALEVEELWLSGPLGQTAAYIVRDTLGATLTTADQQTYSSTSLDALMRDGLGWALPLADLSHYVLGQVPPGVAESTVERDAERRLTQIVRDGWEVTLVPGGRSDSVNHPTRLRMRKNEIEIRLVIDRLDPVTG